MLAFFSGKLGEAGGGSRKSVSFVIDTVVEGSRNLGVKA
jgi:hypothetical protein